MILELDMIQTISIAVVMLLIGKFLVKRISFLEKYCIPAPVVGGIIFAILSLALKQLDIVEFAMDDTLEKVTMTLFFTSVGFSASFRLLKKGGFNVVKFLLVAIGLIVLQNVVAVVVAGLLDMEPLIGLATGSIPMTGGHGTAASFGPDLVKAGADGANTVALSAATFGLVAGSMMGGPVGRRLIQNNNLSSEDAVQLDIDLSKESENIHNIIVEDNFYNATFLLLIAMGIGTIFSYFLEKTGLTFPPYIGAMLAGALMRNISDSTGMFEVPIREVDILGGIALSLFLSMALISLKLWELADLAIPFLIMLLAQVLLMFLYANFITFNVMGRDYDAAILSAGHCGFGLGATPNGIANMNSVTDRYGPSPVAFFILPLVGSLFIDFVNTGIVTVFLNLFS